jgi:hypothetical protein
VSKKKDTIPLDPSDEARWSRAVEKAERQRRRRIQDKVKGSRSAEGKIVVLTEERDSLQTKVTALTKMLRFAIKLLPASAREEFELYRVRFNAGDIEDVHP